MRGDRNESLFAILLGLNLLFMCLIFSKLNLGNFTTPVLRKEIDRCIINDHVVTFEANSDKPHEYPDEVDLRIIIIVGDQAKSLQKQLSHLREVKMDGDTVRLHIWIDRNTSGYYDTETLNVARGFKWEFGQVHVHIQARHVGIYGQWLNTWRPKQGTNELGVIFEDDVDMSPYFYRWAKAAFIRYRNLSLAGIALKENIVVSGPKIHTVMDFENENQTAYLYKAIYTQGYLPDPDFWRDFQDWFYVVKKQPGFRPYVPDTLYTSRYKKLEKENKTHTMWEMWFFHFAAVCRRFTLFPNLSKYTRQNMELSIHRAEKGLHLSNTYVDGHRRLLNYWSNSFIDFPENISMIDFNGDIISPYNNK